MMQTHARFWFLLLMITGVLAGCLPGSPVAQAPSPLPPTPTPAPATATAAPSAVPTLPPPPTATALPTAVPPSPTPTPVVLVGAGDIAVCTLEGAEQTARLLDALPDAAIFTAGDNSNEAGELWQYEQCFGPAWGRHKERIRPSPGNHDYYYEGAQGYYAYFGAAAGEPGQGYYSYDLGEWHIIALNSNCNDISCRPDSAQLEWLRADLAANDARCTLAYWHHPRFSSGLAGNSGMQSFWDALYEAGAEVVVNGHDHDYERFEPQDPSGRYDPQRGIVQFVSGTGGAGQRPFAPEARPNSVVRNSGDFGVLKFTLLPDSYDWEFIPVKGADFTDSGSAACH